MTRANLRQLFFALVTIHLLAGIAAACFCPNRPGFFSGLFIALVFSQTSLLGIWCGLGKTAAPLRFFIVGLASFALALELAFGLDGNLDFEMFVLVFLAIGIVAATAFLVRWFAQIERVADQPVVQEGLQFSILHLVYFTTAVAVLMAIGRWIEPYVTGGGQLIEMCVFGFCFAVIGIVSLWAIFGFGSLVVRPIAALFVAGIGGGVAAFTVNSGAPVLFWIETFVGSCILLMSTLGVYRWLGYRLVRYSSMIKSNGGIADQFAAQRSVV